MSGGENYSNLFYTHPATYLPLILLRQPISKSYSLCPSRLSLIEGLICEWNKTHTLKTWRSNHVSWNIEDEVFLMGGLFGPETSEIVKMDGTTETKFQIKHLTV